METTHPRNWSSTEVQEWSRYICKYWSVKGEALQEFEEWLGTSDGKELIWRAENSSFDQAGCDGDLHLPWGVGQYMEMDILERGEEQEPGTYSLAKMKQMGLLKEFCG